MTNYSAMMLEAAGRYLGTQEWPGAASNPEVEAFFAAAGFPGLTDDVPWCAGFTNAIAAECGLPTTGSLMARSFLNWGRDVPLAEVTPGDVVVLSRGAPPSGHVGQVVSISGDQILIRGGNQGNAVSDAWYPMSRVIGFRRADPGAARLGRPVIREGVRGAFVADLQDQLHELRYFAGRVDGIFGPRTAEAVRAFQAENGLTVDGIVGGRTWAALEDAEPRPEREVTERDLRDGGSRTIRGADGAEVAGGAIVSIPLIAEGLETAREAQGVLDGLGAFVRENGLMVAGLIVGFVVLLALTRKIRAARVEDARTGRHMGR